MQTPTVESLRYKAKYLRSSGVVGFDYWTNGSGDIDLYRFRYDWEDDKDSSYATPHELLVSITPESIPVALDDVTIPVSTPSPILEPTPTPEILPYQSIPKEMRSELRWSVWRRESGKRKIPYAVLRGGRWSTKEPCKSNRTSMWVSFDEALHCLLKSDGNLHGLSFALGHGWAGFDFDDCIVDGKMNAQVKSWLKRLGGYQETSQSGKGVKTVLYGRLTPAFLASARTGRQFKHIPVKGMATEVYDRGRFFFLTGEGRGTPESNQTEIDSICDELVSLKALLTPVRSAPRPVVNPTPSITTSDDTILERIRRSRSRDEFQSLWDGKTVNHKSASEADYALAKMLMFWCGNDKAQVERIFSQSVLGERDKWNRQDYRDRTLRKAVSARVYQESRSSQALSRLQGGVQ